MSTWNIPTYMKHLSRDEEIKLLSKIDRGLTGAWDQFFKQYDPQIKRRAWNMGADVTNIDDLIQSGRLGLIKAIKEFDPKRKSEISGNLVPFYTFAEFWIKKEMLQTFSVYSKSALSPNNRAFVRMAEKIIDRYILEHNKNMTYEELAEKLNEMGCSYRKNVTSKIIKNMFMMYHRSKNKSLNQPIYEDGGSLQDNLGDSSRKVETDISSVVNKALQFLNPYEREILTRKYLEGDKAACKTIADERGVTRHAVSCIENIARKKIKARMPELEQYVY